MARSGEVQGVNMVRTFHDKTADAVRRGWATDATLGKLFISQMLLANDIVGVADG